MSGEGFSFFKRPPPLGKWFGLALVAALFFGALGVNPVQAETDTGTPCLTITVYKFEDKNGNLQNDEKQYLKDWVFTLTKPDGNTVQQKTGNGGYTIFKIYKSNNKCPYGKYSVTETLQNGWQSTTGLTQQVQLSQNTSSKTLYFGNAKLSEICVYKFKDLDGDGDKDGNEPYLSGWTFKLYDSQNNLIGSGTTDASGKVTFWVLVKHNQPQKFKAVEEPQDGYYPTTPAEQTTAQINYGEWAELFFGNAPYGEILVTKFEDLDEDGEWDEDEPSLPDWWFELSQSKPIRSLSTNGQGQLIFDQLEAGTYTVTEQTSEDYFPTTANPQSTTVVPGQQAELTFGNRRYNMDYGDLPEEYNLTLFSEDGARHRPLCPECADTWLGEKRDYEYDGAPDTSALGDDLSGDDDDDGVEPDGNWSGGTGKIKVTVGGGAACLMGWVDYFDEDSGDFGYDYQFLDSFLYNSSTYTEQVIDNIFLTPGTHTLSFSLPSDFANTVVYARFRLSLYEDDYYDEEMVGSSCEQPPAELTELVLGGEVEDYYWQFGPTAVELKKVSAVSHPSGDVIGIAVVGLVASLAVAFFGRRQTSG